ncbi:MAG: helix-turn-helix domain-containing protein [Deltaproteobacteria bacterium]|nr:helix-turn-helix domain-containing protein [Deltaproteobacteria bacterium]
MSEDTTLEPAHCRAARLLLGWSLVDLERESSVSESSVRKFESGERRIQRRTRRDLLAAFKRHGITFEYRKKDPGECSVTCDDGTVVTLRRSGTEDDDDG